MTPTPSDESSEHPLSGEATLPIKEKEKLEKAKKEKEKKEKKKKDKEAAGEGSESKNDSKDKKNKKKAKQKNKKGVVVHIIKPRGKPIMPAHRQRCVSCCCSRCCCVRECSWGWITFFTLFLLGCVAVLVLDAVFSLWFGHTAARWVKIVL